MTSSWLYIKPDVDVIDARKCWFVAPYPREAASLVQDGVHGRLGAGDGASALSIDKLFYELIDPENISVKLQPSPSNNSSETQWNLAGKVLSDSWSVREQFLEITFLIFFVPPFSHTQGKQVFPDSH